MKNRKLCCCCCSSCGVMEIGENQNPILRAFDAGKVFLNNKKKNENHEKETQGRGGNEQILLQTIEHICCWSNKQGHNDYDDDVDNDDDGIGETERKRANNVLVPWWKRWNMCVHKHLQSANAFSARPRLCRFPSLHYRYKHWGPGWLLSATWRLMLTLLLCLRVMSPCTPCGTRQKTVHFHPTDIARPPARGNSLFPAQTEAVPRGKGKRGHA